MLLTISNLPASTRYADLKTLIHSKCGLKEVILDNLSLDGNNTKKVTVGLAEEEDAAILVRKINGMCVEGQYLYVETVKKKKQPAAPGSMNQSTGSQQPTPQQPYYQQSYQQPNYQLAYANMQNNEAGAMLSAMSYAGMYDTSQNAFANYGYPQQMPFQPSPMMAQSMVSYDHTAPLGFGNQGNSTWSDKNDWNSAGNNSGGNKVSQERSTRWDTSGNNNTRSRRDTPAHDQVRDASGQDRGRNGPTRDHGRDGSTRNFVRGSPSRDFGRDGRQGPSRNNGREAPSRDRGRDAPRNEERGASFRDRGRDGPGRDYNRDAPSRNAFAREPNRDATNRNYEPNRAPQKRPLISHDAPPKYSTSYSKLYSEQKPDGRKTNQAWSKQQSLPKTKPAPNNTWNVPNSEGPPAKRQRKDIEANVSSKNQIQTPKRSKTINNPDVNSERRLARSATWRQQACSYLAKEILQNPSHFSDLEPVRVLRELKKGIRNRLENILGDDLDITLPDILLLYRKNYNENTDTDFFNEVLDEMENNDPAFADDTRKAAPGDNTQYGDQYQARPVQAKPAQSKLVQPKPVQAKPAQTKPAQIIPVQRKPVQGKPLRPTKNLPSYPQGDKTHSKELKKMDKLVFQSEDTLLSQIEPNMLKVLNEEIDEMCTLIVNEFQNEPEPEHKLLHKRVQTVVVSDIKKMLKVNFAKRLLNVGPIMVRIFCIPKMVNKTILSHVLADYGVTSLRKPEKKKTPMYYGTCATYEVLDTLCNMEPLIVSGITVSIKPFHLVGKEKRATRSEILAHRKSIMESFERFGENPTAEEDIGDENEEDYNQNDLTNLNTDNDQNDDNEEGQGHECEEPTQQQDVEEVDKVEQTNTDDQELTENDTNENAGTADNEDVKTKGNNEGTEHNERPTESNENENYIEVGNTQEAGDGLIENKEDFTTDQDIIDESTTQEDSFKIEGGGFDIEADKDLSELNPEDLEEISGRKNYDDIDIADLDDDDLEDW